MDAKALAQYALLVLKQLDQLVFYERQGVLHVATQILAVQIAEAQRPQPVRDE